MHGNNQIKPLMQPVMQRAIENATLIACRKTNKRGDAAFTEKNTDQAL